MTAFPADERRNITVGPDTSIMDSIEILNAGHKRIVLVCGEDNKLLGIVTDSDIRHAVLRQQSFEAPISSIMVRNPVCAGPAASDTDILSMMEQTQCYQIPVIDEQGAVHDVRFVDRRIGGPLNPSDLKS